jgi:hypothetical protein
MSSQEKPDAGRRRFLKAAGLASTAASTALIIDNTSANQTDETDEAKESLSPKGYQETEHVRRFLKTLRN